MSGYAQCHVRIVVGIYGLVIPILVLVLQM
jgi:hypothetical protein